MKYPERALRGPSAFAFALAAFLMDDSLGPAASLFASAWSFHTFWSSSLISFHSAPSSDMVGFLPSFAALNSSRRSMVQSMYAERVRFCFGSPLSAFFSFLALLGSFASLGSLGSLVSFLAFLAAGFSTSSEPSSSEFAASLVGVLALDDASASFLALGLPADPFLPALPGTSITLNLAMKDSEGPPFAHTLVLLYHMLAGAVSSQQSHLTNDSLSGP
mmetsp:Transcript_12249/g.29698  ORF Transcript_12249/g.29698 Transcript_12249/m.29698 type:complete len:218 (-) Transcript_12249:131-784(-)